jgi:hypothetical protein
MAVKRLLLKICVFLLLTSCQKSVDWEVSPTGGTTGSGSGGSGNTGGGTSSDLLVKIVIVTGTETVTTLYTYDASKRMITEEFKGSVGGMPLDSYHKFYREANGRIYKMAQLVKQTAIVADTSFTYVYYPNATTSNFTYKTTNITVAGFGAFDSTVYSWNSSGNVATATAFLSSSLAPGMIISTQKYEFIYSIGGNLTQQKMYNGAPPAPFVLFATYNYSYDNITNPITTSGEYMLTGRGENASKNNLVKMEVLVAADPSSNFNVNTSLTYGANGKPSTGTLIEQPSGRVSKYTFYYQ